MDKIDNFFRENPHVFGLLFAVFGLVMLIMAITGAKWLFKKDVSGVTYSLKKIDGWINMFGVKTARIVVGIVSLVIIAAGLFWFFASIL